MNTINITSLEIEARNARLDEDQARDQRIQAHQAMRNAAIAAEFAAKRAQAKEDAFWDSVLEAAQAEDFSY